MAQHETDDSIPQVSPTVTLAVRLPRAKAEAIRQQAADKGYKNVNQYLVAVLDILAPTAPAKPVEQENQTNANTATKSA